MALNDNKIIDNVKSPAFSGAQSATTSTRVLVTTNIVTKVLSSPVTLTSLVDCFTILVVYLLVATHMGSEQLDVSKDMQLPAAAHSTELKLGNIVRIENDKYFLNDKKINVDELFDALKASLSNSDSVIIQADKKVDYSKVNPAVLSALQAGFKQVKFAVLQEDEG